MSQPDRRRVERHPLDQPGELFLAEGRSVPVRILNLGVLGALLASTDLEEAVLEGERILLDHPRLDEGRPTGERARTAGRVVRVDLELTEEGVVRHVAVFFDGGAAPESWSPPLAGD